MSDIHEMRAQMSNTKAKSQSDNKLFLILLLAIPIGGLFAGLGFTMLKKPGGPQPVQEAAAPVPTNQAEAAPRALSTKDAWLKLQASNNKFLAASLEVQDAHPVALKIHQYGEVTKQLANCADFTRMDDPALFLITYYGDLNKDKHDQNLKVYKSSGADKAVLKVAGQKIAKAYLLDRHEVTRMFEQIQADLERVPLNGSNQKTPECQAVMKLVKSAKLNI